MAAAISDVKGEGWRVPRTAFPFSSLKSRENADENTHLELSRLLPEWINEPCLLISLCPLWRTTVFRIPCSLCLEQCLQLAALLITACEQASLLWSNFVFQPLQPFGLLYLCHVG